MFKNLLIHSALAICGSALGIIVMKKCIDFNKPTYKCLFNTNNGLFGSKNKKKNLADFFSKFIDDAKTTIDICFYIITDQKVINAIIRAKKRNVKVRLIIDYHAGIIHSSNSKEFFKNGVTVYYDETVSPGESIMHSKYIIRDGNLILLSSINLTSSALSGSFDNIIITDDAQLLQPFKAKFASLVEEFKYKQL